MLKKSFYVLIVLLSSLFFIVGCSEKKTGPQKKIFKMMGKWSPPPAYNGNPFSPGGDSSDINGLIYGRLSVSLPLTGEFENYLAEDFYSEGNTFIVKIRNDIKWQDGVPFTAKDVYARSIIGGALYASVFTWSLLEDIEIIDDYTIAYHYKEGYPKIQTTYLLQDLQCVPYHIYEQWMEPAEELIQMMKDGKAATGGKEKTPEFEKKWGEFRAKVLTYQPELPIGNTPFQLTKITPSDAILTKVDTFPGYENIDFDGIQIMKEPSGEVQIALLQRGELDILKKGIPEDVAEITLKNNPNLSLIPVPGFSNYGLYMNCREYPFSDQRFRQALAYIIDRDKVRTIGGYYNSTVKYQVGIVPSRVDQWINTEEFNPYDLNYEKATELLEEMGLEKNSDGFWCDKNGKEFNFEIMNGGLSAEEISRQLTSFGIKNNIRVLDSALATPMLKNGKYDMSIEHSFAAGRHPSEGYEKMFLSGAWGSDISGFDPEVIDENGNPINLTDLSLELMAIRDLDQQRQKEIVNTIAKVVNSYLPIIDIHEHNNVFFINNANVTGWPEGEELKVGLASDPETKSILKWLTDGTLKSVKQ